MEEDKLILNKAYGLVKMKIYSDSNEGCKDYFGILDSTEQKNAEIVESDKITVKIKPGREQILEKNIPFSQLVNSGKFIICGVYPKTKEDFKVKRFRLKNVYSDKSSAVDRLNLFTVRGLVDYISLEKQIVIIRIVPELKHVKEFDMAIKCQDIKNELENIECGQYWEINAELVDHEFRIKSGSMIKEKTLVDKTNVTPSAPKLKSTVVDVVKDKANNNIPDVVPEPEPIAEIELINTTKEKTKNKRKKNKNDVIASTEPTVKTKLSNQVEENTNNNTLDAIPYMAPIPETQLVNTATLDIDPSPATPETQLVNVVTEPQSGNPRMQVKSEVVVKISGALPQATPAPNKKVQVEVTDQNGINFTAIINSKSWKKAEANVAQ